MGYYLIHYWNWYNRLLSYTLLATETVLAFLLLRLGGAGGVLLFLLRLGGAGGVLFLLRLGGAGGVLLFLLRLGGVGGDPSVLLLTHFCRLNTSVQCYVHHIKYKGLNKLTCYDNTITF